MVFSERCPWATPEYRFVLVKRKSFYYSAVLAVVILSYFYYLDPKLIQ